MNLDPTVMLYAIRDRWVRQLSRKECLDGREQKLQLLEKTYSFINVFPEEASSRESWLLLVFSRYSALPVCFGFAAAANPSSLLAVAAHQNMPAIAHSKQLPRSLR